VEYILPVLADVRILQIQSEFELQLNFQDSRWNGKYSLWRNLVFAGLSKNDPYLKIEPDFLHYRQILIYGVFHRAPWHNCLALTMLSSVKIDT
jgi:hypothetical protein